MPAIVIASHGHVARALSFYNSSNIFVGVGRTTAWSNESSPPNPTGAETAVEEVFGYKALYQKKIVKPSEDGEIELLGQHWTEVLEANAYTQGAHWVYMSFILSGNELPLTTYRQVGIYTGLTKANGVTKDNLLPAEVQDPGRLQVIDNRTAETRNANKRELIVLIVEF